jgi:hypothetical protein
MNTEVLSEEEQYIRDLQEAGALRTKGKREPAAEVADAVADEQAPEATPVESV